MLDFTVYIKIPETGIRVAVKLLRDASWVAASESREVQVRNAFNLVLEVLQPAVFWDVGANIGFYSWFVRRHASIREVVMFEPDPTNFSLIEKTIAKNVISNCRAINVALSDRTGETLFLVDHASGCAGSLQEFSQQEDEKSFHHEYQMQETITCRTATIDKLIADGTPVPNLLKIDVEGTEHLVLAGGERCLTDFKPVMIVETGDANLIQRIHGIGYVAFRIDFGNVLFVPISQGIDLAPIDRLFSRL